jgi:hypothetical protein
MEVERMSRKTLDDFSPIIGRTFEVADATRKVAIVLVEAIPIASPTAAPRDAFSLLFQGPHDPYLEERTYSVAEDSLGVLEIRLVPVGKTAQGYLYEAVFSGVPDRIGEES